MTVQTLKRNCRTSENYGITECDYMMIDQEKVKRIKELYPEGTEIVLRHMNDAQAPPSGTVGTVRRVDDMGQIHWTGSGLALNVDEDVFYRIDKMGFPIDENGKRIG
jgi:hypothetical protein